jgi:hypothetical protein
MWREVKLDDRPLDWIFTIFSLDVLQVSKIEEPCAE